MATLYVGTSEGYYSTINEAISAASNGDIIIVKGSEYAMTNEKNHDHQSSDHSG